MRNMNDLVRQAGVMQNKIAKMQQEMAERTVEASSGGGMVKVVATCKQDIVSITIDPKALEGGDVEMLQDLVLTAVNEAVRIGRATMDRVLPRWAASRPSSNRGWRVVASLRAAFPPSPLPPSPNESPFPKQYAEQGFDNVKSFGKERGSFWGGEDDRMAPPGRAVPVDASPRLTGIDSNAGSLSEERFPLPQFSVHPNEEVWTTESLNR